MSHLALLMLLSHVVLGRDKKMTDLPTLEHFRQLLIRQEGMRLQPYRCSRGKLSIGVGRNLEDVGISVDEALYLLNDDINRVTMEAEKTFPWFGNLNGPRQVVVLSMIYNLGIYNFETFKEMIKYLKIGDYTNAAIQMRLSSWAIQVKSRADVLCEIMRTGKF